MKIKNLNYDTIYYKIYLQNEKKVKVQLAIRPHASKLKMVREN